MCRRVDARMPIRWSGTVLGRDARPGLAGADRFGTEASSVRCRYLQVGRSPEGFWLTDNTPARPASRDARLRNVMTRSLRRCHMGAPLRAVLLVLCAGVMFLGSTLALANAASSASMGLSMAAGSGADHGSLMMERHTMDDRERAAPCDRDCDPARACSSDCLASCVAGGSSSACAPTNGVPLVYPSARATLVRAPDRRAPREATAPPLLRPPIA